MIAYLATLFFHTVRRADWSIPEAVCHLVDNAFDAGARHVWVYIRPDDSTSDKCIEVIDDGSGLDESGIRLALSLGEGQTDAGSLGTFGLGMKAAAAALGERLEVVSSPGRNAPFLKRVLRFDEVAVTGRYTATDEPQCEDDIVLTGTHLPSGRGTLVRVGGVALGPPQDVQAALHAVRSHAGLVYGPFIRDGLSLQIGGTAVEATDPIRADEADAFEEEPSVVWRSCYRWLVYSRQLLLAHEPRIYGTFDATQRVPSGASGGVRRALDGSEYDGLYVYRNQRLIASALRPAGLPRDEEGGLFGFRGRLLVTGAADATLGFDLRKATSSLPDEAEETLCRIVAQSLKRAGDSVMPPSP